MTLRDYTLIACSLTIAGSVAKLIGLITLPWWIVLAPVAVVAVLAIVVSVALVALMRAKK